MKSKFSPKMLDRIANAWYKGYRNGTGVGRYHYKIEYNMKKRCWGIWKCHNDYLNEKKWEWVEELPEERFQALADQEILEGFSEYQGR